MIIICQSYFVLSVDGILHYKELGVCAHNMSVILCSICGCNIALYGIGSLCS